MLQWQSFGSMVEYCVEAEYKKTFWIQESIMDFVRGSYE
jgi:hypothetical protein